MLYDIQPHLVYGIINTSMITLGVRAHDFGRMPPESLAENIARTGVQCVQLALAKALPDGPKSPIKENVPLIASAFHNKGIQIAVLGCYINPVYPDPNKREELLIRFEKHLASAAAFGCSIVGTETGSVNPECSYHPDTLSEKTFQQLVSSVSRLVRFAEKIGSVVVGIEPVSEQHTIQTPALMRRLLDEIKSSALGVIFDPVNLVPRTGVISQDIFLDNCFESFGSKIVAIHAKDYKMYKGSCGPIKSKSLPAGTGELDWRGVFRRLKQLEHNRIPLLIEDIDPKEIPDTRLRLLEMWEQA